MPVNQIALALIGLLLAAWTLAAAIAILHARARLKRAEATRRNAQRLARMVDESPALPLLVRSDGRIEAPPRLAKWLDLEKVPRFLTELDAGTRGLDGEQLGALAEAVRRTQRTAAPFRMMVTPRGSRRSLALRGHLADPQVSPGGAALVWVFDFSDSESELVQLRQDAERARDDFTALVALIEAAPLPMWFRSPDGVLQLVNAAYVRAVGGSSVEQVAADGIELVETVEGRTARDVALAAAMQDQPIERTVALTIAGQRRAFRITDLPLGELGVAGYGVDIENMEELARMFRAFREAQRASLDNLSAGVAQFDAKCQLVFANLPFQRLFAIDPATVGGGLPFDRLLDIARDAGRLPEVRDFPEWRRDKLAWFAANGTQEDAWSLADGTHLRIVAQPEPDGGLVLIAEDRTEQLRLSAIRDTLLRTRTATFDSLFESVAVFAPDGRLQTWNRRFAQVWGLESDYLDGHPHIEGLLDRVAERLERPAEASDVGEAVRAATLDRREMRGRVRLADERTLEFAGVPLPDGNGLLTALDITDAQEAEATLRDRAMALQEANAVRTRFIAELSQQFRMPLSVIGAYAERLEAGIGGDLNESGENYVAAIKSSVDRIGEHIESLLTVSRPEPQPVADTVENIELMPFATDLAMKRERRISDSGLTLDLRGDKSSGWVRADRRQLAEALGAVLDHAIETTPPKGRILFEITRQRGRNGDCARIIISDTGAGMNEAALAVARGASEADADADQPSALPRVRAAIEAQGGTFDLMSRPGKGTAAIIELP